MSAVERVVLDDHPGLFQRVKYLSIQQPIADKIVTLLRQIKVSMPQGKSAPVGDDRNKSALPR